MVQEKSFRFFEKEVNPYNGLVCDSAPNQEGRGNNTAASIAGTGFALTVYPVAVERGWMNRATAQALTVRTLEFFLKEAPEEKGFFYHYLNAETGKRANQSEVSPIDTSLFIAGALFASEYFRDPKITELTQKLYERVDFPWMLNGGKTLVMAWTPESGFSKRRWNHFDESLLLYILAIGSPTHPIPAESWDEILRPVGSYRDIRLIQMPPLFTHQYPHIWIDFRNQHDRYADYFQNSVNATRANRAFCMDQASKFTGYGPDLWGLTASEGPGGYRAYGAPPGWTFFHDGTIAPTACGSSIVFTPEESIACLEHIHAQYGDKMWGRYGFSDAMNLGKNWFSPNVLAIDQGPLLLMIENYRSGLIWRWMAQNQALQRAFQKIGFKKGTLSLPWPDPPVYHAPYVVQGIRVDGFLKDWPRCEQIVLTPGKNREFGDFENSRNLKAVVRFSWDLDCLYFVVKVTDNDVVVKRTGKSIWRDDMFELYLDPEGEGLYWNDPRDFQLGFRPGKPGEEAAAWSWFQGGEDPSENKKVAVKSYTDSAGYILEGAIRWEMLGINPQEGREVRLSPAIHDIDKRGTDGKLIWFFRNEEKAQRFILGKVLLTQEGQATNANLSKK